MRPVMMTCLAAMVGLLPAAVATGIGSDLQKPLAVVVVGGTTLLPVFILVVFPALTDLFGKPAALRRAAPRDHRGGIEPIAAGRHRPQA